MKVLIQNPENMLYLEASDRWSADVNNAIDFGSSENAIKFCAAHRIAPVHVVLQWAGMPYSIAIPVGADHRRLEGEKPGRARKHG